MNSGGTRDVFLSYSHEEKEAVARPLAEALQRRGVSVWFDEFVLLPGDSLRRSIDKGLRGARLGLMIVSRSFFAREWTQREYDGLNARLVAGELRILPVWHQVGPAEVRAFSPPLADIVAVTSDAGVDAIVHQVRRVLRLLDSDVATLSVPVSPQSSSSAALTPVAPAPLSDPSAWAAFTAATVRSPPRPVGRQEAPSVGTLPEVTIATLGHAAHGKTTLLAALLAEMGEGDEVLGADEIDHALERTQTGAAAVTFGTTRQRYRLVDYASDANRARHLITSAPQITSALLVVALPDGPMPQTREQLLLAKHLGVRRLVVFLSKADTANEELDELVEDEVRNLLAECGFREAEVPVVLGSALRALEGDDEDKEAIRELVEEFDEGFIPPAKATDGPFLLPVEEVFEITGRGSIVTGRIERGTVHTGDRVEIVGLRGTTEAVVAGVEIFRRLLDEAKAGDNVGCFLRDVRRKDVERGQVLCRPGSIAAHVRFAAAVYVATEPEGGRRTPLFAGYRPQFYFRTVAVDGGISLRSGVEMVVPGSHDVMEVELVQPIALEAGAQFTIREGGRRIGVGVVTSTIS